MDESCFRTQGLREVFTVTWHSLDRMKCKEEEEEEVKEWRIKQEEEEEKNIRKSRKLKQDKG